MLSYRHAFHAGNHADVLKHLVLMRLLEHLTQKDSPLLYVDTHAGAGGYALQSNASQKTGEYLAGIGRLWQQDGLPPELTRYVELVRGFNRGDTLDFYPGSPWLARQLLRPADRLFLFELHPTDFEQLHDHCHADRRIKLRHEDGLSGCIGLLPPKEKRGLVLIDPSYEIKQDYHRVVETLAKAWRCFATGSYALWYPVIERPRIDALERALRNSGIRRIQLFELAIQPDQRGFGMTASGMIVINPPWTLRADMQRLLPVLADRLGLDGQGSYRIVELAGE
ncbi:MAG: 23S rRNA (adenine(2030)-N(6))-methyltransferase RlmJ [Gammaproteobacteria bacterium]|nr:23S rRNA (adenine(2030)-N(6))-methyltransferase RlmJ [Gammaproteobacteria bacterium]